ncbi:MAG: NADH-quinone oxidoreductase subunit J, partial [Verrucomicrobia bacterium]|nr:NADH-quinone oxidoreductase subunit J [Verrucomicrobiota bacterium]
VIANPWSRNPITSAMFLVLTIVSMAGLFVLLHAFFLAAIQILVYAGAVMVLFLFVIMLLNIAEETKRRIKLFGALTGLGTVGGLAALLTHTLWNSGIPTPMNPSLEGETKLLGQVLFTQYLLPFEIVSILILVAMVGVILLSKRELK